MYETKDFAAKNLEIASHGLESFEPLSLGMIFS